MVRIVIALGVLLMLAGFGAAGWQFLQSRPPGETTADGAPAVPLQKWLISPTGGLVRAADVRAYLRQDRFVTSRTLTITQTASLADLLAEGEKLPDTPYLQVLADIRAPKLAERDCAVLLEMKVADCALNSARVVPDSVDPLTGKARFRIELVYILPPDTDPLPDLTAAALDAVWSDVDIPADGIGSVGDLIRSAMAAVNADCADPANTGKNCRMMQLDLIWIDAGSGAARAQIGRMVPLPKGVFAAPPLG